MRLGDFLSSCAFGKFVLSEALSPPSTIEISDFKLSESLQFAEEFRGGGEAVF